MADKLELFKIYFEGELSDEEMVELGNKLRNFFEKEKIMEKIEIENVRGGWLMCW